MRQKLFRRLGLKILAVLCAVVVWLSVVNISDPIGYKTFSPIPVTLKNEDFLTNNDMVYEILDDTDSVSVRVKAPRSVLNALTESDIQVVADFENITLMNTVPLQASALRYSRDIEEIMLGTSNMKVAVESSATRQVSVDVKSTGSPKDGFAVGDLVATPSVVTVSGPTSLMEDVAALQASVSVDDKGVSFSSSAKVILQNKKGEKIESDRISLSEEDVIVNVQLLPIKTISFKFSSTGECAPGYQLAEITSNPETLTVAGESSQLSNLGTIEIPASEFDISGATKSIEKEINIEEYLPEGIRILETDTSVIEVTAKIEPIQEKEFVIPASQINVINTPTNCKVTYESGTVAVVRVSGIQSKISKLTAEDVKASINLKGLSPGLNHVNVDVTLPEGITLTQDVSVGVTIEDATPANSTD